MQLQFFVYTVEYKTLKKLDYLNKQLVPNDFNDFFALN